jgi:uncharacterized SAM-binding protein YcdF (DUF218 family)
MDDVLVEMFRLGTALLAPTNALITGLALGLALLWSRWRGAGRLVVTITGLALVVVAVLPVSSWVARPLEARFPPVAQVPDSVTGIIALGGALQPRLSADWDQPHLNHQAERLVAFSVLAHSHPALRLVYAGGPAPRGEVLSEAEVARDVFASLGLDTSRITFEDRSRNTYENAIHTAERLQPRDSETWLLVTTAMHMPRAVGAFRRAGFQVLAYPVDYRSRRHSRLSLLPHAVSSLERLDYAAHEWMGLLAYRLLGRSDALFPGP